jgi:hypothetical protein
MIEENENFEIKTFLDEFNALLNDFPIIKYIKLKTINWVSHISNILKI